MDKARNQQRRHARGKAAGQTVRGIHSDDNKNRNNKAFRFYKECPWDKWWNEFNTARDKNGAMTYTTAWAFAKAKGETEIQRTWIYRCIGPKPIQRLDIPPRRRKNQLSLPHLGDWQIQRAKAYFYDNESVEAMKKVVTERLDGLEAGRGSATVILDLIAKWMKYDNKLDEAFNFSPVNPAVPDSLKEKQADRFFKLKNKTRHAIQELVTQYLQCHGINTDGLNDLGQLVMSVSQAAAKTALAGVATGAAAQLAGNENVSPAAIMLAKAIEDKSKIFSMKLPSVLVNGKEENE